MLRKAVCWASIAVALLAPSAGLAAANDFEVQASNVDSPKIGDTYAKGARIVLKRGARITLIERKAAGKVVTRECGGSYDGPVEKCPAPAKDDPAASTPGATRGLRPATR
jgi:hypothetical protein